MHYAQFTSPAKQDKTVRQVRSASECVRQSHCAAWHFPTDPTQNAPVWQSSRLNSHSHTRHDKNSPVCVVSGVAVWTERLLLACSDFKFLSATVLSCRESNSHHRSGRDTDKTVLSCLAWRCELVFGHLICTRRIRQYAALLSAQNLVIFKNSCSVVSQKFKLLCEYLKHFHFLREAMQLDQMHEIWISQGTLVTFQVLYTGTTLRTTPQQFRFPSCSSELCLPSHSNQLICDSYSKHTR